MSLKVTPFKLKNDYFEVNAFHFDSNSENPSGLAVFSHGYTASKSDCISWAHRLSDHGINSVVFDWPGHYLGGSNELSSFEDFKEHGADLFVSGHDYLLKKHSTDSKLIIGGHSLGALMSLKALGLKAFEHIDVLAIAVGIGIYQGESTHIFESSFYQKTLSLRRQLVHPYIDSDLIFPWIKEQKNELNLTGKRIHIITGKDDVVVGQGGAQALFEKLKQMQNNVTIHEPKRMPHHEPSSAATYINAFIKKELSL